MSNVTRDLLRLWLNLQVGINPRYGIAQGVSNHRQLRAVLNVTQPYPPFTDGKQKIARRFM